MRKKTYLGFNFTVSLAEYIRYIQYEQTLKPVGYVILITVRMGFAILRTANRARLAALS